MSAFDALTNHLQDLPQIDVSEQFKLPIFPKRSAENFREMLNQSPFGQRGVQLYTNDLARDAGKQAMVDAIAEKLYPPLPTEDQRFPGGHPEQYVDEVLMGNYEDISWLLSSYTTKRTGRHAYDLDGRKVPGAFPVFVKRSELESHGWSVTADGRISKEDRKPV
jgi:hypothetical protein